VVSVMVRAGGGVSLRRSSQPMHHGCGKIFGSCTVLQHVVALPSLVLFGKLSLQPFTSSSLHCTFTSHCRRS